MKRWMVILLVLTLALPCLAQGETFKELTGAHGFLVGAPLSYGQMFDEKYLTLVSEQFSSLTTTNEMKAYSLLDQRASQKSEDGMPRMNYTVADQMVGFARDHGVGVRGHVLVWDAYMLDWYFHEDYDSSKPYADQETVRARTESYIKQVITHFEETLPGTVYCWDVVNEAVGDNSGEYVPGDARHLRTKRNGGDNLFYVYMGEDYVAQAFLYARNTVEELGADIKLYYNDYNAYFADKAKAILALAQSVDSYAMDAEGKPRKLIDGIGMQGYIGGYGTQSGCLESSHIGMIRSAINGYAAAGYEVQITEMAVRNFDTEAAQKHADFYAALFDTLKELGGEGPLRAVSIWGLTDYPNEPKGTYVYNLNSPYGGLFTENLEPKEAFDRVIDTLR